MNAWYIYNKWTILLASVNMNMLIPNISNRTTFRVNIYMYYKIILLSITHMKIDMHVMSSTKLNKIKNDNSFTIYKVP